MVAEHNHTIESHNRLASFYLWKSSEGLRASSLTAVFHTPPWHVGMVLGAHCKIEGVSRYEGSVKCNYDNTMVVGQNTITQWTS